MLDDKAVKGNELKMGALADALEARKRAQYDAHWRFFTPAVFVPFALDNYGALSKSSLDLIASLKRHAKHRGSFCGEERFWEHLSIGLVKGIYHGYKIMAYGPESSAPPGKHLRSGSAESSQN